MHMHNARYMLWCGVCVCVCHVRELRQNEYRYLRIFFTIGSDTILVFPHQRGVPIFRREPP